MIGRALNPVEIDSYDIVRADVARRVRVIQVPFIPGGYSGMTIGRLVLLARSVGTDGGSALLAHELVHARQWNELGVVGFPVRYLTSFVANLARYRRWSRAYRGIDAEVEARQETTDWLRRRTRDQYG